MIKKFHFILKSGTLTDEEKEWFNVGDCKRIVTMYLDYAEDQAERRIPMTMEDWKKD